MVTALGGGERGVQMAPHTMQPRTEGPGTPQFTCRRLCWSLTLLTSSVAQRGGLRHRTGAGTVVTFSWSDMLAMGKAGAFSYLCYCWKDVTCGWFSYLAAWGLQWVECRGKGSSLIK